MLVLNYDFGGKNKGTWKKKVDWRKKWIITSVINVHLTISCLLVQYCLSSNTRPIELLACLDEKQHKEELFHHFSSPFLSHLLSFDPLLISFFDPYCQSSHFFLSPVCLPPSLSLYQSVPQSPALPYVTGAHIRENNLWLPWIRDAAQFPMIQVWYENSLKYLDRGEVSDQCSPACCWQTRVSETSCREHPRGLGGLEEEKKKVRGN